MDSPERAYQIAAEASTAPGPGIRGVDGALGRSSPDDGRQRGPDQVKSSSLDPRARAPAARPCAAGAGRGGPAVSRLRRVRRRRAGSADRRGCPMAARRHSGQSARLADSGRAAAHDATTCAARPRDEIVRLSWLRKLPGVVAPHDIQRAGESIPTTRWSCCSCAVIRRSPRIRDRADAARGRRSDDQPRSRKHFSCPRRRWRSGSAGRSRASRRSRVPFRMPDAEERAQRLSSVLHVLYLVFNEGYTSELRTRSASRGSVERGDSLVRAVHKLLPDDADVDRACSRSCS